MSSSVRKQAPRLPRPAARYWKGKAPKGADSAVNEDSDEEQEDETPQEAGDVSLSGEIALDALDNDDNDLAVEQNIQIPKRSLNIALKDVSISRDGKVTVAGREESGMTAAEAGAHLH
jgi:microfibrillar-associated protein 1